MKRLLILVLAVMALSLVSGCTMAVDTHFDSGRAIEIGVDEEFVIAIGTDPDTGYGWEVKFDETRLELVEKVYKSTEEETEQEIVGTGGIDYFRFRALETGVTGITMTYKRIEGESTPQDITRVFTVNVE